jgi:hypothetical protein
MNEERGCVRDMTDFVNTSISSFLEKFPDCMIKKLDSSELELDKGLKTRTNLSILASNYKKHLESKKKILDIQLIGGPKNVTLHWHPEFKKMIYIFGEVHSFNNRLRRAKCKLEKKKRKRTQSIHRGILMESITT